RRRLARPRRSCLGRLGGVDGGGDGFGGGGLHLLAVDQHGRGGRDAALDRLVGELRHPWGVLGVPYAGGEGGVDDAGGTADIDELVVGEAGAALRWLGREQGLAV